MMETIAVLMPGDMGHAVGRALGEHGHQVITCLEGRSDHSRNLAQAAGIEEAGSFNAVVRRADLILSILPPACVMDLAANVAKAMDETGATPVYADCNAVSPATVKNVAQTITAAGAPFIDCGIIGAAPGRGGEPRFYTSGADVAPLQALDGKGIKVVAVGEEVGRASALKMTYAGLTKGTWTLHTALLLAARQCGVLDELLEEFSFSQAQTLNGMRARIPRLPADSARWVGEMEEIAATFADAGVPSGFHHGAAEVFKLFAQTPFASETRQSMDSSRTLEDTLAAVSEFLPDPE
jgi:3-hydroxyisobutyrate dehydrogenase-like beta-hydroxyacid dehydrogenase